MLSHQVIFVIVAVAAQAKAVAADVAVPSNNNHRDGSSASPPSGPLPDPLDLDEADTCNNDGSISSDGKTCSQGTSSGGVVADHDASAPSSSPSAARTALSAVPTGKFYCPRNYVANDDYYIYGNLNCFYDNPHHYSANNNGSNNDSDSDINSDGSNSNATTINAPTGDFVNPHLNPGEVAPLLWRHNGKIVSQYALQVGLPPSLTSALLQHCHDSGITDHFQNYTSVHPLPLNDEDSDENDGQFLTLSSHAIENGRNYSWYAQRQQSVPDSNDRNNVHFISPANENTHEHVLRTLAKGEFDSVLEGIGMSMSVESLMVYHVEFMAVSYYHSDDQDQNHVLEQQHDAIDTKGGMYVQ
mmetsp:Transcript_8164/g.17651  ORF Transcript_8164/g.17651 Transcript_8164/m.17651 type:complete len:357 (-) Transcript_8164:6-1076(-)